MPQTQDAQTPICSIASLQQGFCKLPPRLLGLLLNVGGGPHPVLKEGNLDFLPWRVALPGPVALPAPSHCQVYCPAAEQEFGLPQLPAEQIIPPLREASLDEAGE